MATRRSNLWRGKGGSGGLLTAHLLFLSALELFNSAPAVMAGIFVTGEGACAAVATAGVSSLSATGFAACGGLFFG
jgi:hypothetical protein